MATTKKRTRADIRDLDDTAITLLKGIRARQSHDEIAHLNTGVGTRIFASWLPESAYVLPEE